MELSQQERLILMNQFMILELLNPDESEYYSENAEIVRSGYESHYSSLGGPFFGDTLPADECNEVVSILSMFRTLKHQLDGRTLPGVEEWMVEFGGFDGNNEGQLLSYAKFFCKHDGGRFAEFAGRDFNSHTPMLEAYRRMLAEWREQAKLSDDDVIRIANAVKLNH